MFAIYYTICALYKYSTFTSNIVYNFYVFPPSKWGKEGSSMSKTIFRTSLAASIAVLPTMFPAVLAGCSNVPQVPDENPGVDSSKAADTSSTLWGHYRMVFDEDAWTVAVIPIPPGNVGLGYIFFNK